MTAFRVGLVASFVAVLAGVAALPGGFPAQTPNEVKISASIHVEVDRFMSDCPRCGPNGTDIKIPSCNFVAVAQFPNYNGAVSYSVTVSDTVLGDRGFTGPPFYDDQEGAGRRPGGALVRPLRRRRRRELRGRRSRDEGALQGPQGHRHVRRQGAHHRKHDG